MYWLTRLDDIEIVLTVAFILSAITCFITLLNAAGFPDDCEWSKKKAVYFYRSGAVFLLTLLAGTLTPSSKEMAAILIIPKIVNNEKVAALPSKIVDLATDWLDALKPKKQ
jgi:hypothetical protein